MILFWLGLLTAGLQRSTIASKGAIIALMSMTLLFQPTLRLALASGRAVSSLLHHQPSGDLEAAHALQRLGLQLGDGIAVVGESFEPYYAWMAGLREGHRCAGSPCLCKPGRVAGWSHNLRTQFDDTCSRCTSIFDPAAEIVSSFCSVTSVNKVEIIFHITNP
jgi:hypothetical protein